MVPAVAVIVVTRQQVAGIEREKRGGKSLCLCVCVCVCIGVQRESPALCASCCPPMAGVSRGVAGRQRVPADWERGSQRQTKSSTHILCPTHTDTHTRTHEHFTPSHDSAQAEHDEKEGSKLELGQKSN